MQEILTSTRTNVEDGALAALGVGPEQAGRIAEALTHALGSSGGPERFDLGDPNDAG